MAGGERMSRSVEEWVGRDHDTPIPKRVKLRVLLRYGGRCYRTGHKFRAGDPIEYDHINALCNAPAGENWNRESNIAPILGGKVHQAKTAEDVKLKTKCDRIFAKHHGLYPSPTRKLQSRPFPGGRGK